MPELVLDRVTKQFKNKIAVDQVSLNLTEGVHGFLGANGAGKTTLLRMLCGVLKPTSGEILCDWAEIRGMDGEPPTFTQEQVAAIIALSCEDPSCLGLPFSHWTPSLLREL